MSIITTSKITKQFTKVQSGWPNFWSLKKETKTAIEDLNIEIEEGELVGFLGPNGAGKTTFLKILAGIMHPTFGQANILGFVPWERNYEYLRQIAIVMGQKNQLWWDLPAIDSFNMLKEVYEISDQKYRHNLDKMVEVLNMKELLTKRLRNMSLGERMKCELTASFLHDPKVIFLDEPTIGLDIVSAKSIRNFLKDINKTKKCTMILTSHYMGDIEELCKRVIIINHGKKIFDGALEELKNQYAPEKEIVVFLDSLEDKKKFAHLKFPKKLVENKGILKVDKKDLGAVVSEVFDNFKIENVSIADIETEEVITKIFLKTKANPDKIQS
ncbi:MAG: ABC transporter related-protein [Berkelbacteria bacterium GW2011_GWA1_36_9]|uniref:ABC transporter related-protein n=1 Tax=Berkelbacteria bacterium GW2011_GWA1_36_9 TaxID=1618331 RepID=A0A0G0FKM7_9BACT|nr:MAG: ABC transporter related-protein [Berkelbacteria bacterium GW2011_GWA1_36_9]